MACGESGGSKILLCLGILVVASSFCHCTRLTRLKALDRLRGNSTLSKDQAEGGDLRHGRLLIGQNSLQADELKGTKATENVLDVDTDYQEDMGWGEPQQPKGQVSGVSRPNSETDSAVVERLLRMEPKVECTGDSMKLQVQDAASTCGSLFFVDRGSRMSPLPLSKLPSSCGYTIKSTQRDLVLVAPYDGCFVALEEDSYILPLRWCGLPVRMSCPLKRQSSPNPPMVTCHAEGMVVKTTWTVSVADLNLKLNGNWEPLMKASARCGFSVVVHPEGVVISVRYAPCLEKKDGMYTLELAGDRETQISCPSLSPAQTEQPKKPVKGSVTPSKVEHPSLPSPKNPAQSVLQVPKIPEPKDVYQPPLPSYPNFFYPFPRKPNTNPAPTIQPSLQTVPPAKLPVTPKGQVPQPFIPSPFYPWPAQPEVPVAREGKDNPIIAPILPEPEAPQGQVHQPFYPYPFYPQPVPEKPTAAPKPPQPEAPQGQVQQPFYPQPKPEKPTAAPKPEPEAPQGQVQQPFYPYPFPFYPQPEKPTTAPKPPQPEAPQGQVQQPFYPYPFPFYPQPEPEKPTAAPKPPQPEAPQGQVQQPFYPYPFYPQPEPEKPTAAPKPPQPEAPQGQVQQPFYPQPEKPTAAPKPPQPEAPQGQVQQPFYPYPFPFYPQPEPEKPTATPKPPQPEAPQGQVQQPFYPYPFYRQPEPEKPTAAPKPEPEAPLGQVQQPFYPWPEPEKPTAAPEPEKSSAAPKHPQPEAPQGQVQQPFYPYPFPFYPQPEKPTTAPKPPQPEAPRGQVHKPFYPFYRQPAPEYQPAAVPKPPATETPKGQEQKPAYPQDPQPETPYMPPVYCPRFCPPGFSNCCPQIAFHQHLHQIVPAGIGSENAPLHYPLLPFLPSKVYNGFGNGLSSAPPSQMPTEATTTSTSAPTSSQSLPYGNEKQPPDGNPAVLNILSMPNNPEQPIYPYIVPNSLYPNWPYLLQNSQHHPPAHYNMPSKPQTPGSEPVNPLLQYEPHNLQPPKQQNGQLPASFMPYNGQYLQQQQNQPTAKELQPSNQIPSDSKEPMPPKVQSELDPLLIPYYMLQDDQSKTQDKSTTPNPLQPSWSASRKSPKPEQTVHPYSDPKSYVLLQHGPPGREPNRLNESPLHFRYPAGDADFLAQNPARQHSGKPQHPENSKPPHEKPQHPKQPGKEISSPFPNVNYMPRSGDNSDVPFYSLNGPHFAPLPQDPSVSTTHLNPKFKGFWRPMTPLGSGQRIQPLVPGKSFKRRSSTADDQAKGLNQPIQREVGNWKP
ncbi:uncharacterized protein LOC126383006 [Epinephelus moara]|uniref:uncharacterized protein LOC126383006 n=1 Tax=Epinephelus moara TaxID=300413 RepID=UPI00214E1522|nr:uncharacterized protein LOC126383006 [Epinephelus moara]